MIYGKFTDYFPQAATRKNNLFLDTEKYDIYVEFEYSPAAGDTSESSTEARDAFDVAFWLGRFSPILGCNGDGKYCERGLPFDSIEVTPGLWGGEMKFTKYRLALKTPHTRDVMLSSPTFIIVSPKKNTGRYAGAIDNFKLIFEKKPLSDASNALGRSTAFSVPMMQAEGSIKLPPREYPSNVSDEQPFVVSKANGPAVDEMSAGKVIVSNDFDSWAGGRYLLSRLDTSLSVGAPRSSWEVGYFSNGNQLGAVALRDTSHVLWRGQGVRPESLVTNGWLRVCAGKVWVVQDGYQLLVTSSDLSLGSIRKFSFDVGGRAEVDLVNKVSCAAHGGLLFSGYLFGVSASEPSLSPHSIDALSFQLEIRENGDLVKRSVSPVSVSLLEMCQAATDEQKSFCIGAQAAMGRQSRDEGK
jgi:hypothetical protein